MIIQCTLVGGFIDALHIRLKKQHGQVVSQAQVEANYCRFQQTSDLWMSGHNEWHIFLQYYTLTIGEYVFIERSICKKWCL